MDLVQQLAQVQAQLGQMSRVQQMLANPVAAAPAPVAQQSPAVGQQELLLKLYDEFVNTDDGKQLAANLAKFARFAQSKVAKQEA